MITSLLCVPLPNVDTLQYFGSAGKRERLWAGEHSFPFHYTLPAKLPASFHGRFGYIRYFCEAILERSALPNVLCQTMFSVNNIADVNIDPKADVSYSISVIDITFYHRK
jgi:hypothetical protein